MFRSCRAGSRYVERPRSSRWRPVKGRRHAACVIGIVRTGGMSMSAGMPDGRHTPQLHARVAGRVAAYPFVPRWRFSFYNPLIHRRFSSTFKDGWMVRWCDGACYSAFYRVSHLPMQKRRLKAKYPLGCLGMLECTTSPITNKAHVSINPDGGIVGGACLRPRPLRWWKNLAA